MKLAIVSGSHRLQSNSIKVARHVAKLADGFTEHVTFELARLDLPLWDEGVWQGSEKWKTVWTPIATQLRVCDAIVLVAPEWAGMVPPALKNFLLLCGNAELGHKPAMIIGISSGLSGSYPIAELRMSGYKNNRMVYIPDHMVIRDVGNLLNGDEPTGETDAGVRARLTYSLKVLAEYAKALKLVRDSGVIDYKTYPFGQ
jgi:NAD(P)H-dependent FMN reductase